MKGSRLRSLAAASLGIAALALAGCGGGGGGGDNGGGGNQTTTITGSVIDKASGRPPGGGAVVVVQGNTALSGTVDGTTGKFTIANVPQGQVTLEVHETCVAGPPYPLANANGSTAVTVSDSSGNVGTISLDSNTYPPPGPPLDC